MSTILLLLAMVGQHQPRLCNYRVTVYRNSVPTCTFKELKRVTASGYTKTELYTDIQTKLCAIGGHGFLIKSETFSSAGLIMTGIAVRCNVPFLLPSDIRPRE